MNYTSLPKRRSFIITTIYPIVLNILFDANTLYIVIIINLTNKTLILNKNICLDSIYKYIDILYIIINIAKVFTVVTTTSIAVFELFIVI